jgi:hypothetical protein
MKTLYCSLLAVFFSLPVFAAHNPDRVLKVNQPPVHRALTPPSRASTLSQPPNQSNGVFADAGCSICTGGEQSVADDFIVSTGGAGFDLKQILFWGGYYSTDTPPATDDFDVLIHSDNSGVPGTVICSETGITTAPRTATGQSLFGVSEYIITIDLASTCTLADGTYWIEIYNDTGSVDDDFFWEVGDLDGTNGIAGSLNATETPGITWTAGPPDAELAMQLNGDVVPVELLSFSIE